ncbi:MAG: two-component system sensor histidine kinase NtrB [Burkholderiales bacterium]
MSWTLIAARPSEAPANHWRSLHYFNLYRLTVAGVFVVTFIVFGTTLTFGAYNPVLFFNISIVYVFHSLMLSVLLSLRWPRFEYQLRLQIVADVVFIVLLMYASGGIKSGLGLLLLIPLAATGPIDRGRLVMFYAALASIALLAEQSYRVLGLGEEAGEYFSSGLLSMGLFATAGLAHVLARRALDSEKVAQQRGIDVRNFSQINQLIIEDMQDGVLVVDGTGLIMQHNMQAEKWLRMGALVNRETDLQACPDLETRFRDWLATGVANPEPLHMPAGAEIYTHFVPVGDAAALGAVIFLEDLGRLKERARQLKLAALGRLSANIAHEIRNPLSSISYAVQLLQEERQSDPTHQRLLQIIADNTRRLDKMIQDVSQLNRRDRVTREAIKLEGFVKSFCERFCQVEGQDAGTLGIAVEPGLTLCFDPSHLDQVLWNLTRNAWRHCRKQKHSVGIRAAIANPDNIVQLDVVDDGPGVAAEVAPQLFEPFFSTESQGSGLGLYVAREICQANDAALDYVDAAAGALFRISGKGGPC